MTATKVISVFSGESLLFILMKYYSLEELHAHHCWKQLEIIYATKLLFLGKRQRDNLKCTVLNLSWWFELLPMIEEGPQSIKYPPSIKGILGQTLVYSNKWYHIYWIPTLTLYTDKINALHKTLTPQRISTIEGTYKSIKTDFTNVTGCNKFCKPETLGKTDW